MKQLFLLLLITASISAAAQRDNDLCYTAKCGKEYCEGDTIILGRGSGTNGQFLWLQMGGWAAAASYNSYNGPDQLNGSKGYAGQAVTIKRIKQANRKGIKTTWFVVGVGNITNYYLLIDDAIETGEVKVAAKYRPKDNNAGAELSIADELAKLNKLKKDSILTEDEYQAQKKKLLEK